MRVNLLCEIESDLYGDEKGRSTEYECRDTGQTLNDGRSNRKEAKEYRAWERYAIHHIADILFGLTAWAYAWNEGTGLLKVLCDAMWLERYRGVEVRKEHYEHEVDRAVLPWISQEGAVGRSCANSKNT